MFLSVSLSHIGCCRICAPIGWLLQVAAQLRIGDAYYYGRGVPQDYKQALRMCCSPLSLNISSISFLPLTSL